MPTQEKKSVTDLRYVSAPVDCSDKVNTFVGKNLVGEDLLLTAAVYGEDQQPFINFHLVKQRRFAVIF